MAELVVVTQGGNNPGTWMQMGKFRRLFHSIKQPLQVLLTPLGKEESFLHGPVLEEERVDFVQAVLQRHHPTSRGGGGAVVQPHLCVVRLGKGHQMLGDQGEELRPGELPLDGGAQERLRERRIAPLMCTRKGCLLPAAYFAEHVYDCASGETSTG